MRNQPTPFYGLGCPRERLEARWFPKPETTGWLEFVRHSLGLSIVLADNAGKS